MSANIHQIFIANPLTTNTSTDLMYFGQSPYAAGNDAAMTYANFAAQFGAPYTASALTRVNDTNVTLTLGGTPATSLLQAVSLTLGWSGQLSPARGGSGLSNPTAHGVLIAEGASNYNTVNATGNNQFLFSSTTSSDPVYATISFDSTFTTNYAANALIVGSAISVVGTATTTGATTQLVTSVQIPANKSISINCIVSAYESTTPTNASFRIFTGAIFNGSTTTVNSSPVIDAQHGSTLTSTNVTITGGATNTISVNVVGQTGLTIKWSATLTYTISG